MTAERLSCWPRNPKRDAVIATNSTESLYHHESSGCAVAAEDSTYSLNFRFVANRCNADTEGDLSDEEQQPVKENTMLGAVASSAGDDFHELWAMRHSLALLDPSSKITGIKVEGLPENAIHEGLGQIGQVVDIAVTYGGDEKGPYVRYEQLKYSPSDPHSEWTWARLTANKSKTKSRTSILGKIAQLIEAVGGRARFAIVTNQPAHADVVADVERLIAALRVSAAYTEPLVTRLLAATGCDGAGLLQLLEAWDLSGFGSINRLQLETAIISSIGDMTDADARADADIFQQRIRTLMLPEGQRASEITRETVMTWLGVGTTELLYPAPSRIVRPEPYLRRAASDALLELIMSPGRPVRLTADGGCGKTSLVAQLLYELPAGSEMIAYDCYGDGLFLTSDDRRHLPENALVQVANELAATLTIPLILRRETSGPLAAAFRHRLQVASDIVRQRNANALIVLCFDAADNARTAANHWKDACFLDELLALSSLPDNIRLLLTCRSGRKGLVGQHHQFRSFHLTPFDAAETNAYVTLHHPWPAPVCTAMHDLAGGTPRRLAYAIDGLTDQECDKAVERLMPRASGIDPLFERLVNDAGIRLGDPRKVWLVLCALANLPRPTPAYILASLAGLQDEDIGDIANDVGGIVLRDGGWSFQDEDFEHFVDERTQAEGDGLLRNAADTLFAQRFEKPYAARAVGEVLMRTGRFNDLYDLVRSPDNRRMPVEKIEARKIEARRLTLAIKCCREADEIGIACSLLIAAADGIKSERLVHELLSKNLSLSCRFSADQIMPIIFRARRHAGRRGPMRLHLAAASAVAAPSASRDHFRWWQVALEEWSQRPTNERFAISPNEIAAEYEAIAKLVGTQTAVANFLRWRPLTSGQTSMIKVIQHLGGNDPSQIVEVMSLRQWPPRIRMPLLAAALASGVPSDDATACDHLVALATTTPARWNMDVAERQTPENLLALSTLAVCELMADIAANRAPILSILNRAFPRPDFDQWSDINRFAAKSDLYARFVALREKLTGILETISDHLPENKQLPERSRRRGTRDDFEPDDDRKSDEQLWNEAVAEASARLRRMHNAARCVLDTSRNTPKALAAIRKSLARPYNEYGRSTEHIAIVRFVNAWLAQAAITDTDLQGPVETALAILKDWQVASPKNRIDLAKSLALAPSAHGAAAQLLTTIAADIESMAGAASERAELLMACADTALPIDQELARNFYERAIAITEKVDFEAIAQLEMAAGLAGAGLGGCRSERMALAERIADTGGAVEATLELEDRFPWSDILKGIAGADLPTAFAVASQWRDVGIAPLEQSIPALLDGAEATRLSTPIRFALSVLADCNFGPVGDKPSSRAIVEFKARSALLSGDTVAVLDTHWETRDLVIDSKGSCANQLSQTAARLLSWRPSAIGDRTDDDDDDQPHSDATSDNGPNGEDEISEATFALQASCISQPQSRTPFLRRGAAAAGADGWFGRELVRFIDDWARYPVVATWARGELPNYIALALRNLFEWRYSDTDLIEALLQSTGLDPAEQAKVVFDGILALAQEPSSELILVLAGVAARRASRETRSTLLQELLDRIKVNVDQSAKFPIVGTCAPDDVDASVARAIYAAMADISREVRWQASHAALQLIRLDSRSTVHHLASLLVEDRDAAFSDRNAPFYAFAAREQLLTTFLRGAVDNPGLIAETSIAVWDCIHATPHVIIRELGKRVLLLLETLDYSVLSASQNDALRAVNVSPFSASDREPQTLRRGRDRKDKKRNFNFDDTDTIPYWYSTPAAFFGCEMVAFLDRVEKWVHDKWGFVETDSHWLREPRIERLRDESGNSSHRHGTVPVVERLSRYVEWHGMMCAIGELLYESPLLATDKYGDTFQDWIEQSVPTLVPYWLWDLRTPPPLEPRFWSYDSARRPSVERESDDRLTWPSNIPDDVFDVEMGLSAGGLTSITIAADFELHGEGAREDVVIRSGLVAPENANALARALATVRDHMDFIIPPADDHREIKQPGFELLGWLEDNNTDPHSDRFDAKRGAVSGVPFRPSARICAEMQLKFDTIQQGWTVSGAGQPCLSLAFWGEKEPSNPGAGWRGTATPEFLKTLLEREQKSMLFSVEIARDHVGDKGLRKRQWRMFVLNQEGQLTRILPLKRSLGRYWVRKLGMNRSCDTLARWRLHKLEELALLTPTLAGKSLANNHAAIRDIFDKFGRSRRSHNSGF